MNQRQRELFDSTKYFYEQVLSRDPQAPSYIAQPINHSLKWCSRANWDKRIMQEAFEFAVQAILYRRKLDKNDEYISAQHFYNSVEKYFRDRSL